MKKFLNILIPSVLGSVLTIGAFMIFGLNERPEVVIGNNENQVPSHRAVYTVKEDGKLVPLDFTGVSKDVMSSVVHITSTREVSGGMPYSFDRGNPLEEFFRHFYGKPEGNAPQRPAPKKFEQKGTGSGV